MAAAVASILAEIPRKAFGYLLIFVIAEIVENATPYPRSDIGGYLIFAVFVCGAIALSSFLKLLPFRIKKMRKVAVSVALISGMIVIAMFAIVVTGWLPELSSHAFASVLMVSGATIIYLVRTTRPDLLRREEESERKM